MSDRITPNLWRGFSQGLIAQGYNPNEVVRTFNYAGGSGSRAAKNYFDTANPDWEMPRDESRCVCGHWIKNNFWISDGVNIITVGSCCIERWMPNGMKRTCECCKQVHRNLKDNQCNDCRTLIKQMEDEVSESEIESCDRLAFQL